MSRDLKDKTVVITGAAEGIGLEIAHKYLLNGAGTAILLDIDEKLGTEAEKDLCSKYGTNKAIFMKCDVTKDLDNISAKIIDTYNTVDVLVNNAGVNDRDSNRTIAINLQSVINWSFKFWEHMRLDKGGKGGTIINLSSKWGFAFDQYAPVYQASKAGVLGFTKSLGHPYNFRRSGVRVIAICPSFTETRLTENIVGAIINIWDDESVGKDFAPYTKTHPWQKTESVGKAAVEVFENADSGTAWFIEGGNPIKEVGT